LREAPLLKVLATLYININALTNAICRSWSKTGTIIIPAPGKVLTNHCYDTITLVAFIGACRFLVCLRGTMSNFFLLGLFTERIIILGNQHKQWSPCSHLAKEDRSYSLQFQNGSIVRAEESVTTGSIKFGNSSGNRTAACIANTWTGLTPLLRSDSPG